MSAATLAFVVAIVAFVAFGVILVMALLPFVQHVSAALPR